MLGIEILFGDAQHVVLRDFLDRSWVLREIVQPKIVELDLGEDVRQFGAGPRLTSIP